MFGVWFTCVYLCLPVCGVGQVSEGVVDASEVLRKQTQYDATVLELK